METLDNQDSVAQLRQQLREAVKAPNFDRRMKNQVVRWLDSKLIFTEDELLWIQKQVRLEGEKAAALTEEKRRQKGEEKAHAKDIPHDTLEVGRFD